MFGREGRIEHYRYKSARAKNAYHYETSPTVCALEILHTCCSGGDGGGGGTPGKDGPGSAKDWKKF